MTLIITFLLLHHMGLGAFWYFAAGCLWLVRCCVTMGGR